MKLNRLQLRRLINEELSQASKPTATGRKNHASGYGIAKDQRGIYSVASCIALHIDQAVDEALVKLDVKTIVSGVLKDLADERSVGRGAGLPTGDDKYNELVAKVNEVITKDFVSSVQDVVDDVCSRVLDLSAE